ncbi:MAG: hypothetical protein WAM81_02250 [Acidimicrobiia bacterium]
MKLKAATAVLLMAASVGIGACADSARISAADPSQTEVSTAGAVLLEGPFFHTPEDAAIAATHVQFPDPADPQVTRVILIWADDTTVDLRVQVQAFGFCHWYGVGGDVHDGALRWWSGPSALPCEPGS